MFKVYRDSPLICNKSQHSLSVADEDPETCHISEVWRCPVVRDMVEYALQCESRIAASRIPSTEKEALLPVGLFRFERQHLLQLGAHTLGYLKTVNFKWAPDLDPVVLEMSLLLGPTRDGTLDHRTPTELPIMS